MTKIIGKYEINLTGSLITIKKGGSTIKAFDTNPLFAIEKFNELSTKLSKIQ
tara:strand:- start:68303 stop:68458 length:156 start_codon:yes stop_codon:yes gene_type:complete